MWKVNETTLIMAEDDYGVSLPITIHGTTLTEHDSIKITIKDSKNGNTILTKEFSDISNNTVDLVITRAESALLPVGAYVYSLDWYQTGEFMCNIILDSLFRVVDKA